MFFSFLLLSKFSVRVGSQKSQQRCRWHRVVQLQLSQPLCLCLCLSLVPNSRGAHHIPFFLSFFLSFSPLPISLNLSVASVHLHDKTTEGAAATTNPGALFGYYSIHHGLFGWFLLSSLSSSHLPLLLSSLLFSSFVGHTQIANMPFCQELHPVQATSPQWTSMLSLNLLSSP